jgi:hypothetical protein
MSLARLRTGAKLVSRTCETQVVVVRAPGDPVDLRCGGAPMDIPGSAGERIAPDPALADGTTIGKRYVEPGIGLEVMCIRPGAGSLSHGDTPLELKSATPLPTSD